ncbi:TadE/TadG family type IV pilus assembly protein [Planobispora takensis]|uniref:TadE/TadG family type IV pilus assembly protein n=1 Tax=Planobispora takensis TaxID=1367882 RepID=UPI001EF1CD8E|nr:TadE/TadG family type IV pilus assembly protein [Planobispora takensis]
MAESRDPEDRDAGNCGVKGRGSGDRGTEDRAAEGRDRERGATAVELAMIMPVVLIVILLVVQFALWFHGRQVADAAAREGARLARVDTDSWQRDAETRAREVLEAVGPELLGGATATAWEEDDRRGVEITATAVQVIPLLPATTFTITARFGGPVECFRPDDGSEGCE